MIDEPSTSMADLLQRNDLFRSIWGTNIRPMDTWLVTFIEQFILTRASSGVQWYSNTTNHQTPRNTQNIHIIPILVVIPTFISLQIPSLSVCSCRSGWPRSGAPECRCWTAASGESCLSDRWFPPLRR